MIIKLRSSIGKNPKIGFILRYAPIVFVLLMIGVFLYLVPINDIVVALLQTDLKQLVYGFLIIIPFLYFDVLQTHVLTRIQGISLSVWEIFILNLRIRFYQMFTPASLAGGAIRSYFYVKATNDLTATLAVLAYSRLYSTILTLVFGLIFWLASASNGFTNDILLIISIAAISFLLFLVLPVLSKILASKIPIQTDTVEKKIRVWLIKNLRNLFISLASFSELRLRDHIFIILYNLVTQVTGLLSYYWIALSLGIELGLADIGWIRSVIVLSLFIPVNFSAGVTVREIGFAAILIALGTAPEIAGAFSLLVLLRTSLIALTGGCIEMVQTLSHRRKQLSVSGESDHDVTLDTDKLM